MSRSPNVRVKDLPAFPDKPDQCWLHPHPRSTGYGRHREYWMLHVGPIPDGMDLDHECHNRDETCAGGVTCSHRACYNPNHLTLKTRSNNLRDGLTYSAEVNKRRGMNSSKYLNQESVKSVFRSQGRQDAIRGWEMEDRSSKFCDTCGGGPYKGSRALAGHRTQKGCNI